MGLERIAAILEDVDNIFEVEAIKAIVNEVAKLCEYEYGLDEGKDESIRVITDHTRAAVFLVSDGVLPGNEGRGYILRRLIRRAARHGKLLDIQGEFLTEISNKVIDSWKIEYQDIEDKRKEINKIIRIEESKFQKTIDQGIYILESYIKEMEENKEEIFSGEKAFKLYDTYGFPLDLTKEILEEKDLKVDEESFNENMEEQRNRARNAREGKENSSGWGSNINTGLFKGLESVFIGYEEYRTDTNVLGLFKEMEKVKELKKDDEGIIILKETPFYAESGGQVGDIGIIENDHFRAEVLDTQNTDENSIIHIIKVLGGTVKVDDQVVAIIKKGRREDLKRNHTATHLLHKALNEVLGDHVKQAGSIVLPDRLRFDFSHYGSLSNAEILEIERIVNNKILESLDINSTETSLEDAKARGAVGLFEDKYGDVVRVVEIGDYSKELCGGTHVNNTANIGLFKILSESGIASGVRRIEAITGRGVYEYMNNIEYEIEKVSNTLKTNKQNLNEKANSILDEIKEKDQTIEILRRNLSKDIVTEILNSVKD